MKKKKKADKKASEAAESDSSSTSRTFKEDPTDKTNSDTEDLTCFKFLIFILSFAAYSSTCYRSFPGGDSTELIGNGSENGYGPWTINSTDVKSSRLFTSTKSTLRFIVMRRLRVNRN